MSDSVDNRRVADLDAPLLARIANGDQDALGELYDRFSRPLLATVYRILNDQREAEDIVHDAFVAVWQKAADYDPTRGSAFSWVMTLTRNRALDRVRSRKRRAELLAQSAPADLGYDQTPPDVALAADIGERGAAVRQAFGELPAEQRQALELAYFSGLTQQEIADRLQQPLGTVKARIRRGLLKLRDLIAPPSP
ncbi:MAG: sigma-70 family RNA polymerase sigma factor [Verrucomicrobiota bacterium]